MGKGPLLGLLNPFNHCRNFGRSFHLFLVLPNRDGLWPWLTAMRRCSGGSIPTDAAAVHFCAKMTEGKSSDPWEASSQEIASSRPRHIERDALELSRMASKLVNC